MLQIAYPFLNSRIGKSETDHKFSTVAKRSPIANAIRRSIDFKRIGRGPGREPDVISVGGALERTTQHLERVW